MATRFRWLESIFGGLDRIYVLHKWIGITALGALLLHDTIDADIDGISPETFLTDLAETLGELSLYGILILLIITVATFIPYHLWRWTHRFMGAFFALSTFHYVYIIKPFATTGPLGLYVLFFCCLGMFGYLYTLLPKQWFGLGYQYSITDVKQSDENTILTLSPKGKKYLKHQAGQFAFLTLDRAGLNEPHPYTISSGPRENQSIEFTIKSLGDFTHALKLSNNKESLINTTAYVKGPYGLFKRPRDGKTSVWIAGGIGITPFKAWADTLESEEMESHLFYCINQRDQAVHLSDLEKLAQDLPSFHLHIIDSDSQPRISTEQILEVVGKPASELKAFFCGPKSMRMALSQGLRERGLHSANFHYEEFEIRSGIGARKLGLKALSLYQQFMVKRRQK
jgi:predicted ferric reductase